MLAALVPLLSASDQTDTAPWSSDGAWRLLGEGEVDATERSLLVVDRGDDWVAAWSDAGLAGEPPMIDFEESIAIVRTTSFGSACPPHCQQVRIDAHARTPVELQFLALEPDRIGAAEERGHALAVEVRRSALPAHAFLMWQDERVSLP